MYFKFLLVGLAAVTLVGCSAEKRTQKQSIEKKDTLQALSEKLEKEQAAQRKEAVEFAKQHDMPVRKENPDGSVMEIQKIENGMPMYYGTDLNEKNHSETFIEQ
ncbi:MAG: hypothetical protein ABXS92_06180 [Sulfurimonas sp.]